MVKLEDQNVFIGIDMDSEKFDCYSTFGKGSWKTFSVTNTGMTLFKKWVSQYNQSSVSLEGFQGQNAALEIYLKNNNIPFYSIPPYNIAKFRESTISKNKNNFKDAKAVANFTYSQSILDNMGTFKNEFLPNEQLRQLTRRNFQINKGITAELSSLWKILRILSPDMYLLLKGRHPDYAIKRNMLKTIGVLNLFFLHPDISTWSNFSKPKLIKILGQSHFGTKDYFIKSLRDVSRKTNSISLLEQIPIKQLAQGILLLKNNKKEIEKALIQAAIDNSTTTELLKIEGMGIITASAIQSEIINIKRFKNDDKLASYSGLGRRENKTGNRTTMTSSIAYNRYLKNAFISLAIHHIKNNPEGVLALKYKEKLKLGNNAFYCRKCVTRAILRRVYRILKQGEIVKKT